MKELVEVYEVADGLSRPGFGYKPRCIALLSPDESLPNIGDIIILPRSETDDTAEQAFYYGTAAPFRVVDREYLYMRTTKKRSDDQPVPFQKTWIHVRRITAEDYERTPGQVAKR
ncbi:hypothetical protein [Myxococcus virescens]|uniref:Uncharacterized protein n=1 Tax=Myxococcus virescens TaxID=83456 RepID=A0A511HPB6_9BACT|nr:hypothetical protein [Myxococcus virescens]GEL75428.1 hypothetical protein MVI01_72120 [Myxococcus virescens]SDE88165.1 hypothetical protein SAMN04488504_11413 [Myxococcus virescens]